MPRNAADRRRFYAVRSKVKDVLGLGRGCAEGLFEKATRYLANRIMREKSKAELDQISAQFTPPWLNAGLLRSWLEAEQILNCASLAANAESTASSSTDPPALPGPQPPPAPPPPPSPGPPPPPARVFTADERRKGRDRFVKMNREMLSTEAKLFIERVQTHSPEYSAQPSTVVKTLGNDMFYGFSEDDRAPWNFLPLRKSVCVVLFSRPLRRNKKRKFLTTTTHF